jgi:hypothetical protein
MVGSISFTYQEIMEILPKSFSQKVKTPEIKCSPEPVLGHIELKL